MAQRALTRDSLESTLATEGIVVLDFGARWCRPCHLFSAVIDRAAERHRDVVFASVDTDAEQELAAAFGVTSLPTVVVFRDGVMVFSGAGSLTGRGLTELIASVRDLDMAAVRERMAAGGKIPTEEGITASDGT
ncbi:MAG TPA: thioredoxin family protein [Candidatus Avipropionibacterium avicola]|uniref:Thioredoxin family protein n=1 Tax=Candidatus Avipropionibacterium avicola TaxID=2840701 RepID=A0A9D1KMN1_9ACTN|nr:thioredoxin family protein [Candidatus Avipropionibacterium avicola]